MGGKVACIGEMRNSYKTSVGKPEGESGLDASGLS